VHRSCVQPKRVAAAVYKTRKHYPANSENASEWFQPSNIDATIVLRNAAVSVTDVDIDTDTDINTKDSFKTSREWTQLPPLPLASHEPS
jgi:hypothetical protein